MRSSRAERRRLQRILDDEDYGPALVRLPKRVQQRILEMISAGRGRLARKGILQADAERKAKAAEQGRLKRAIRKRQDEQRAQEVSRKQQAAQSEWERYYEWIKTNRLEGTIWEHELSVERAAINARIHSDDPDAAYALVRSMSQQDYIDAAAAANREEREWSPFFYHY